MNDRDGSVKGECVLFVGWKDREKQAISIEELDSSILDAFGANSCSTSKLAKKLSLELTLSRQEIYDRIVILRSK